MDQIKTTTFNRGRLVAYWIFTGLAALQIANGAWFDLSRNKMVTDVLEHLGYPIYLLTIIGVWRVFALFAILVPKFPLIKEWAYAGLFFEMTGALTSHIIIGDGYTKWLWPFIFLIMTAASWYLRPPARSLVYAEVQV